MLRALQEFFCIFGARSFRAQACPLAVGGVVCGLHGVRPSSWHALRLVCWWIRQCMCVLSLSHLKIISCPPFLCGTAMKLTSKRDTVLVHHQADWPCDMRNTSFLKVLLYLSTFSKKDLFLISGQSVVAFFCDPHVITTVASAGKRIGVGCQNGEPISWGHIGHNLVTKEDFLRPSSILMF